MYKIFYTSKFKKDYKTVQKRKYNLDLLREVTILLSQNGELPKKYYPHKLSGVYSDCWECHIKPDWLLIWTIDTDKLEIWLTRTGTHSDLF
jgi:mRNA interferase YafQ